MKPLILKVASPDKHTAVVALIHRVSCMTWAYAFNFSKDSKEVPNPIAHPYVAENQLEAVSHA